MKILLIGATGQIGYALAHALARTPHEVRVLVRRRLPFPAGVEVLEADGFTREVFGRALEGVDRLVNGVGLPEQFSLDAGLFERVNLGLLGPFLEALEGSGVRRLTYVSTYEVFEARGGVIRESHPVADTGAMTPYFRAMTRAYERVAAFAERTGIEATTIHPAAVYGGLNTGFGVTDVVENLLNRRFWRLPVIIEGSFPVVHADSLAEAVVASLEGSGAYVVSDAMTSLPELARALKRSAPSSLVPPTVPVPMAYASVAALELLARMLRTRPILAKVQVDFLTAGAEPSPERAIRELGWRPMELDEGIRRYLRDRGRLLALPR